MSTFGFEKSLDGGIATVTLNEPTTANALNSAFFLYFPLYLEELVKDKSVKCLVITHTGNTFCSGIDLRILKDPALLDNSSTPAKQQLTQKILELQKPFLGLVNAPFPVIAAVKGPAIGAGLDLLLACDMAFGLEASYVVIEEVNHNLMADLGTLQRLFKFVPPAIANYYAFTGEHLTAADAHKYGLLVDLLETPELVDQKVQSVASSIAQKTRNVLEQTKKAMLFAQDHSFAASLVQAAKLQAELLEPKAVLATFATAK